MTRVRLVIDGVAADVPTGDRRSDAELRAELGARVTAALERADRSGLLWEAGSERNAGALDPQVVAGLVGGAVRQTFGATVEP